jgi:hypothetical protein
MAASTEALFQSNGQKKRPETLWRLVDAKCTQLKDTVSSARIALLAVLAWAFAMFVARYNHEVGYVGPLLDRYENAISQIDNGAGACAVLYGDTTDQKIRNEEIPNGWVSRYHNVLPEFLRRSSRRNQVIFATEL